MWHSDSSAEAKLWAMEDRILISQRIACPEGGYPLSEARFANTKEWEEHTGMKWIDFCNRADIQNKYYKE